MSPRILSRCRRFFGRRTRTLGEFSFNQGGFCSHTPCKYTRVLLFFLVCFYSNRLIVFCITGVLLIFFRWSWFFGRRTRTLGELSFIPCGFCCYSNCKYEWVNLFFPFSSYSHLLIAVLGNSIRDFVVGRDFTVGARDRSANCCFIPAASLVIPFVSCKYKSGNECSCLFAISFYNFSPPAVDCC